MKVGDEFVAREGVASEGGYVEIAFAHDDKITTGWHVRIKSASQSAGIRIESFCASGGFLEAKGTINEEMLLKYFKPKNKPISGISDFLAEQSQNDKISL